MWDFAGGAGVDDGVDTSVGTDTSVDVDGGTDTSVDVDGGTGASVDVDGVTDTSVDTGSDADTVSTFSGVGSSKDNISLMSWSGLGLEYSSSCIYFGPVNIYCAL